jgi:hypothetical protein
MTIFALDRNGPGDPFLSTQKFRSFRKRHPVCPKNIFFKLTKQSIEFENQVSHSSDQIKATLKQIRLSIDRID